MLHFIYFCYLLLVTNYLITKLSVTYNFSACREYLAENHLSFSFCSSLGSTLLLIERTMIDPLYLWVITRLPPWARPLPRGPPGAPPTSTPTLYIHVRGEKIREKDSSRFTIWSRRQALHSLGRADLESVRGSGEGNPSPSSSSTFLHHQFHDAHRRA